VVATALTCGSIFVIEVALHWMSDRSLDRASAFVTEIGRARNDLYLGFLHLSLGNEPGSPWQRPLGQTLLSQSLDEFKATLALLPAETRSTAAPALAAELEQFSALTREVSALPSDPAAEMKLRSALYQLDRLVAQVDGQARAEYATVKAQLHPIFRLTELLSGVLLLLVSAGAIWAGRRQAKATDALARSEDRFRRLFEDAPIPMGLVGKDGAMIAKNTAFQQVFGYAPADIQHIEDWWRQAYPDPAYRQQAMANWQNYLAETRQGDHGRSAEVRVTCKGGEQRIVQISGIVLADGGVLAAFSDLTDRSRAEADLRASQERLARSQKLEAIGQLTGGIAHDFNNLLAVIMGNVEMLKVAARAHPECTDYIERTLRATRRGAELTRRLLAYARQQELNPQRVNLNELVQETVNLLLRTLAKNIVIETELAPEVDGAIVDRGQLENALLNLAVNARDAMPQGGKLVIATAAPIIGETEAKAYGIKAGDYESIAVTDNGAGMPPEVLVRAFDPFFTTKEPGKGTGLGLSMVYGFVRQSGGHATINSEPGIGTTVTLILPRPSSAPAMSAPAVIAEARYQKGAGEAILVVEDVAEVRQMVALQLSSLGYQAEAVESADAALQRLREGTKVDLVLTDVMLTGGMDGVELSEAARALRPGLRFLFMSGYAEGGQARERIKAHGDILMEKPFTTARLSALVAGCLNPDTGAK
jgi:PAS domain S-box-containing protein